MFQIGIDSFIHAITGLLKVRNLLLHTNLIEIMINSFELRAYFANIQQENILKYFFIYIFF